MNIGSASAGLVAAFALAIAAAPVKARTNPGSDRSLDHVLVWTRNVDNLIAALAVKLGFHVRPGGEFDDGVAILRTRCAHLYGVGIEVADLARARRIVERGYGTKVTSYKGATGDAFIAPTHGELGFLIEFHASSEQQKNGEQE